MNTQHDQVVVEVSKAVLQVLLELHIYPKSNAIGDACSQNVETLVAAGALSNETIARFESHQFRFHGLSSRISHDTAVLDVELADRTPSLRVVGFADGHAECLSLDKQ